MSSLSPYINLRGTAREAMDFYHSVFGGEMNRSTFGEFGMARGADDEDLVMHSQLVTEGGMILAVSDAPDWVEGEQDSNIQIALSGGGEEAEDLRTWFEKLSGSGSVTQPLEQAPWGDHFGACQDAWGVHWMVNISGATA